MKKNDLDFDALRHEYTEANNSFRHYSTLRFAMFTVYFAVIGGISAAAFGFANNKDSAPLNVILWAKLAGLMITICFAILEVICEKYLQQHQAVLEKLENKLGYNLVRTKPKFKFPRAYHSTWALYSFFVIFWAVAVFLEIIDLF